MESSAFRPILTMVLERVLNSKTERNTVLLSPLPDSHWNTIKAAYAARLGSGGRMQKIYATQRIQDVSRANREIAKRVSELSCILPEGIKAASRNHLKNITISFKEPSLEIPENLSALHHPPVAPSWLAQLFPGAARVNDFETLAS
jgi:hypothetical protein